MDFRVLGPIEARDASRKLPLGGPKQRVLLAALLLRANEAVSRDDLIDGLWGERPPATAGHTLDAYVSRLRKLLGGDRLSRQAPGYLLRVEPDELDLAWFDRLAAEGRRQLAAGDPRQAASTLRSALELWRGPALGDILYEPFASTHAERLEERRCAAIEDRIDAELACGRSGDLVVELEQLVAEHPFRERLLGQLMLALYRSGQQARALDLYRAAKKRFADELGLDLGPQLRRLERQILEQDAEIAGVEGTRARQLRRRRQPSRRRLLAGGLLAVVATGVAAGILLGFSRGSDSSVRADANQILGLSFDSAGPDRTVSLDAAPAAMVAGESAIWLADPLTESIARVDPGLGAVVDRIPVSGTPGTLAVGGGAVWAAPVPGDRVVRVDPETGTITQTVRLGGGRASALAFGLGGLWVADIIDQSLLEVDPSSGVVRRTLTLPVQPSALAFANESIWVADYDGGTVTEVEARQGNVLSTVHVGNGPSALAAGLGAVWVANSLDSTVSRIDPARGSVAATIPVGSGPAAVQVAAGAVWVANQYSATVSRIDHDRNVVGRTLAVGGGPTSLAAAAGRLWVGTRSLARHRGGTLRLLHTRPITIDPALQVDLLPLVSDRLTRDSLVTYDQVPAPGGIRLVPDLAIAVPRPTGAGTTYAFRLRPGIRYSDGRPLRASDFRRAIERLFRLQSLQRVPFNRLRGAVACTRTHCDLSEGIVAEDARRTVTFHLREPDPDFLSNLTSAAASPVPRGTAWHDTGLKPIPGTGPYRIAAASRRELRWVRNPFFHEWSHAAQPDGNANEIVMRFGLSPEQEVREVEAGRADWLADFIPARLVPALRRRVAGQLHSSVIPTTDFFQINTMLRPFDDVRVRRAFNFALDRAKIVRIYGGPDLAAPTCQVLPPGVPGYRRYCPYTATPGPAGSWRGPDLARAQRLVAASATRGQRITVWGWTDDPTISPGVVRYAAGVLRRLGYRVRVRLVPHAFFADAPASLFRTIQVIATAWGDKTYGFFDTWFGCEGAYNHDWFCDAPLDRQNLRARSLAATNPRAAADLWADVDRKLVDQAVSVPMINERGIDFVSARVRNYQWHPYWGIIAAQLWLR
jgi:YVTN family beta-propeller protein